VLNDVTLPGGGRADLAGSGLVRVQVGIDAAVVADHHVCVREYRPDGQVRTTRFHVPPTLAGLRRLGQRLAPYPGVVAVAEPTSMTWLGLSIALRDAGLDLSLVGARHAARLRGAITGKAKSDVIDADVLAMAADVFPLTRLRPPLPDQLGLRRACTRRGKLVIDGNRAKRRLISLARWAFPDVWSAFAGSMPTATAVLTRWPNLNSLATARRSSLTAVVAAHTRGVPDVPARAEAIRAAAGAWARFWDGHLDLDALGWEVAEHLADLRASDERIARATAQATRYWALLYGDDPLLASLPGMGPMTAPTVRAFLGDGSGFSSAKAAASYVGMTPSTWSSGTITQPSRAITKEGPPVLRLAFYQAAGGARRTDPHLAAYYQHLMLERGHCHTQATVAVARKLIERTWTVLARGEPYQLRDVDGSPVTIAAGKHLARTVYAVPEDVRARARARTAATHRAKLTK
jgi:transposase